MKARRASDGCEEAFQRVSFGILVAHSLKLAVVPVLYAMALTAEVLVSNRKDFSTVRHCAHARDAGVDGTTCDGFFWPS